VVAITLKRLKKQIDCISTDHLQRELERLMEIVAKHEGLIVDYNTELEEAQKKAENYENLGIETPWNWHDDPRTKCKRLISISKSKINKVGKKIDLINEELVERILTGDSGV
jgi:hypothetical protein